MGFWYLIGVAGIVGLILAILGILKVDEIIGSMVVGGFIAAMIAAFFSFFGIDFWPVFVRSAVVLVPLCLIYQIFHR